MTASVRLRQALRPLATSEAMLRSAPAPRDWPTLIHMVNIGKTYARVHHGSMSEMQFWRMD